MSAASLAVTDPQGTRAAPAAAAAGASTLPVELWRAILEFATSVEGEFDPAAWLENHPEVPIGFSIDLPYDNVNYYLKHTEAAIVQNLATRRSIVGVSRQWHRLGLDILYSSVPLRNQQSADAFLRSLQSSPSSSLPPLPRGGLVKRLSISYMIPLPFIQEVILPCPNVQILNNKHKSSSFIPSIFTTVPALQHCKKLEYLFTYKMVVLSSYFPLLRWFFSLVNLRVLAISQDRTLPDGDFESTEYPTASFPYLHTLKLYGRYTRVATMVAGWDLPSLHRLICSDAAGTSLELLLSTHGPKIQIISFMGMFDKLPQRAGLLPNLRSLAIDSVWRGQTLVDAHSAFFPPSLEVFEAVIDMDILSYDQTVINKATVQRLVELLCDTTKLPALRTFRAVLPSLDRNDARLRPLELWADSMRRVLALRNVDVVKISKINV